MSNQASSAASDRNLQTSDITTNNASSTKHGFLPKVPNTATNYLDGTGAWVAGAWTSWTPTWTGLTATSSTQSSRYTQIGKTVTAEISLVWGASTAITGDVSFSLPVTAASGYTNFQAIGVINLNDASNLISPGTIAYATTTTAHIYVQNASATYTTFAALSSTIPFTWTTSDGLLGTFTYEAA